MTGQMGRKHLVFLIICEIAAGAVVCLLFFMFSGVETRKVIVFVGGLILVPIVIFRPLEGFLLFLVGLPFLKANIHLTPHFDLGAIDIFVLICVIPFLLRPLFGGKTTFSKDRIIIFSCAVYVGTLILSSLLHFKWGDVEIPELLVYFVKNRVVYVALFFITIALVRNRSDAEKCYLMIALSGIVLAIYAFIEVRLLGKSFDIYDVVQGAQAGRLVARSYSHSNVVAMHFVMTIPLLFFLFLRHPLAKFKALGYFGTVVCLVGLFLTFARSAWIAALLPVAVLGFRRRGTFVRFMILSFAIFFLLAMLTQRMFDLSFIDLVAARFGELQTSKFSERPEIWSNTLTLIVNHPLWGVGLGNFKTAYWLETAATYARQHAHNVFLFLAAETGLISTIAFMALFSRVFYLAYAVRKRVEKKDVSFIYCGLLCALAGMFLMLLVENIFFSRISASLFFVELGLMVSVVNISFGSDDASQIAVVKQLKSRN